MRVNIGKMKTKIFTKRIFTKKKDMVHIVRINQSTIRENPDYSTQPREEVVSMQANFIATEEAIDPETDTIKYPEWVSRYNYFITASECTEGVTTGLGGVCSGSEIPELMKSGKEWPGISIEITSNTITHLPDTRKYLFEYEAEPEFLSCGGCLREIPTHLLDDDICPVCETQLIEYENLDISMVP